MKNKKDKNVLVRDEQNKIFLKDIFQFEKLLSNKKGKRIKLRFNMNWPDESNTKKYDFVEMYYTKSPDFEPNILSCYSISGKTKRNSPKDLQFSFIRVEEEKEYDKWLFIGAYDIIHTDNKVYIDSDGNTCEYAETIRLKEYDKYVERVIVKWKNINRNFFYVKPEIINSIELDSILSHTYFSGGGEFPGFENLSLTYNELKKQWNNRSWREHLSSVYGVYLITDLKNSKLYVGAAYGEEGVYGRWSAYLRDGYDKAEKDYPNKKLKALVEEKGFKYIQENFKYTLLEIFKKDENGKDKALKRELYWKKVFFKDLMYGYNDNW